MSKLYIVGKINYPPLADSRVLLCTRTARAQTPLKSQSRIVQEVPRPCFFLQDVIPAVAAYSISCGGVQLDGTSDADSLARCMLGSVWYKYTSNSLVEVYLGHQVFGTISTNNHVVHACKGDKRPVVAQRYLSSSSIDGEHWKFLRWRCSIRCSKSRPISDG